MNTPLCVTAGNMSSLWPSVVMVLTILCLPAVNGEQCPSNSNFSLCNCTWREHHIVVINCTNTFFVSDKPVSDIINTAPSVEKVILTGNHITNLSTNIFGSCPGNKSLYNLTYLDLSGNDIRIIHGQTFHCLPNLRTLKLNNNIWIVDDNKGRVFSSLPSLKVLHLENAFASSIGSNYHLIRLKKVFSQSISGTYAIEELHLERNAISHMDDEIFCDLHFLKRLYLSGNKLTKIGLDPKCMPQLEELYMTGNALVSLTKSDIAVVRNLTLTTLDLRDNPFECRDCTTTMAEFRDWINSLDGSIILDRDKLSCDSPAELQGKKLVDLTDGNLEGTCDPTQPYHRPNKQVTLIAVMMVLLSLMIVVIIVMVINREQIQREGCWKPLKDGTSGFLRRTLHYGYATMENDVEESCTVNT